MARRAPLWQPTTILRHIRSLDTGAETVIVETDQGEGYLKPMGNRGGPHPLACEWVGTSLARRLGLPTFAFAIVEVTNEDEIPLAGGGRAEPGPAFISRSERGKSWGGSAASCAGWPTRTTSRGWCCSTPGCGTATAIPSTRRSDGRTATTCSSPARARLAAGSG